MNMRGLRWRFFMFFIGLGVLVFISAAIPIFVQYSEYIRNTYTRTLNRALALTYSRFPIDGAKIIYVMGLEEKSPVHIETIMGLKEIATAFDLAFIYLVQRHGTGADMVYRFLLSSYDVPGIPDIYSWDDAPPELSKVFDTGQIALTGEYTDDWGTFITAFLPVFENGKVIAVWGADFRLGYIQALRLNSIIALIIAFLGSGVIATVFALIVSSSLTRPIHEIEKVSTALAAMDFGVHIDTSRKDEIGKVQKAFMKIRDSLKSNFSMFSQNASKVSSAVYDLSSSAKEITTTANEQSTSVAEIVSSMENNKGLSGQIAIKTTEVAELAAQTESLSQHGANLHDANEQMMADVRKQNSKVVDEIRNLTDVLFRINESVQFIDTIADRTKIIAFNAALEASSAGEAGQRFSVVASEIRRFAVNVVESVSEIKERISELQDASESLISEADIGSNVIDSGYNRMVEQKEVFENIVDVSQNVAVRSQQISNLSKQQELASGQVFTALKEISAGVNQFVVATSSTSAAADNLKGIAQELKETLARYQAADKGGTHDDE